MEYPILFGIAVFVALLTGTVGIVAFRQRPAPGSKSFAVMMAGASWWGVIEAAKLHPVFHDSVPFAFLIRAAWLAMALVALGWFLFGLTYTGRGSYLTRRRVALISIIPGFTVLTAFSHQHLVGVVESQTGPLSPLVSAFGSLDALWPTVESIGGAYFYLLILIGSVFIIEVVLERRFPHPGQLLLLLMLIPPLGLNLAQVAIIQSSTFNPTIIGLSVSGVAGLFAVGRFRAFAVPLARANVVEEVDTGVLVYGRDGIVFDYNEYASSLLGLSEPLLGTDIRTVLTNSSLAVEIPPELSFSAGMESQSDVHRAGMAVDGGVRTIETFLDERTVAVHSDERTYVEMRVSELREGAGNRLSRVLLLYDVSARERRRRTLERKNEQLERLAQVISHDLQTPISTAEKHLTLVRYDLETPPEPVEQSLDDLESTLSRIQQFAAHLPRLARESTDVENPVNCSLALVSEDAWAMVETGSLQLEIVDDEVLVADPRRLQQLFENLFDNVFEHAVSGLTPELQATTVRVGTHETGFYVADDGPGISAEQAVAVFEYGMSTGEGTGIGLAIVRSIAEAHDWRVELADQTSGTTIHVHTHSVGTDVSDPL